MKLVALMCTAAMVLSVNGCKDTTAGTVTNIDAIVFPASKVSYNTTIQPLFNIGCAMDDCHSAKSKKGNLDLSDYYGLKQRSYDVVIAYDTLGSKLIWYIDGRQPSAQWHRPLNPNHVQGFKTWIMEGATKEY
ncbi:MAG: hypothetical protein M0R68_13885 [Bacteroidetes bacterium]|nr:hypothetical protein [Bacteroidota bacterium]